MPKLRNSIYLASASPRRRELLQQIGVSYEVVNHTASEERIESEEPRDYVLRVAIDKARSVLEDDTLSEHRPVLSADTIVVCDDRILGKPQHKDDALAMIKQLSNKLHLVYSAVCVGNQNKIETVITETTVGFRKITDLESLAYWNSGEPVGKAGAYAIQGLGAVFVNHLSGSYTGVVGLPLFETAKLLSQFDVRVLCGNGND